MRASVRTSAPAVLVHPHTFHRIARELEEAAQALEAKPVAWRVRGYAQFKTGKPGPWRYFDGPDGPAVNTPDCCDFEPLYSAVAQVMVKTAGEGYANAARLALCWNTHDQLLERADAGAYFLAVVILAVLSAVIYMHLWRL